ncbi:MAG: hypothetical protein NT154_35020, partial [Verrucomicrobia bacterium]|nr:hypothetical protein [Verrucomicrobiota bacterium]
MKTSTKMAGRWSTLLSIALTALIPAQVRAEVLTVPSDGTRVVSQPLLSGVEYVIRASGTWFFNGPGNPTFVCDAAFQTFNAGATWIGYGYYGGTLQVTNGSIAWFGTTNGTDFRPQTFSPSHIYQSTWFGAGQPLAFFILDSLYSDNSGSLQVSILAVTNLHRATATADVTNGSVVGATITDGGSGYFNPPLVLIQGGAGTGATATAVVSNGVVINIIIT